MRLLFASAYVWLMQMFDRAAADWYTVYRGECLMNFCSPAVPADAHALRMHVYCCIHTHPCKPTLAEWLFLSDYIISHGCVLQSHCPVPMLLMSHSQASLIPVWLGQLQCFTDSLLPSYCDCGAFVWLGIRECVFKLTPDKYNVMQAVTYINMKYKLN